MKFTKEKIIGLVGAVVCIIGLFLPFITVSVLGISSSATFISGDGVLVLIGIVVAAVLLFLDKLKIVGAILSAASIGIAVYDGIINAKGSDIAKTLTILGGKVTPGIGFYVVVVGAALLLVALLLPNKTKKVVAEANNISTNVENPTISDNGNNVNEQYPWEKQPLEQPVVEETVEQPSEVVEQPIEQNEWEVGTTEYVSSPTIEEPVTEPISEPVVEEPVFEQPVVEEPVVEEPVVEEPVFEQPVVEEPVVEQPIAEEPITEPTPEQPTENNDTTNIFFQ